MVLVILPIVKIGAARPLIDARGIPAHPPTRCRVKLGWGQPSELQEISQAKSGAWSAPRWMVSDLAVAESVSCLLVYNSSYPKLDVGSWLDSTATGA